MYQRLIKVSFKVCIKIYSKLRNRSEKFISGNKDWENEKIIYEKKIAILEPFTESVPSAVLLATIWYTESWIKRDHTFEG